ncbi:MAG: hypothetical protein KAI64_07240 [Thermoplasmata archaeon]|nr:hypothetical protein [Thermoplasmata archaeon]
MNKLEQAQITMSGVRQDMNTLMASTRALLFEIEQLKKGDVIPDKALRTRIGILEEDLEKCGRYYEEVENV